MDPIILDFIGGALLELQPRNGMDGILVAQIITNHLLAMKFSRLTMVENLMERTRNLDRGHWAYDQGTEEDAPAAPETGGDATAACPMVNPLLWVMGRSPALECLDAPELCTPR
jgi:hypothetical protein